MFLPYEDGSRRLRIFCHPDVNSCPFRLKHARSAAAGPQQKACIPSGREHTDGIDSDRYKTLAPDVELSVLECAIRIRVLEPNILEVCCTLEYEAASRPQVFA
jgi:hypothetical protein